MRKSKHIVNMTDLMYVSTLDRIDAILVCSSSGGIGMDIFSMYFFEICITVVPEMVNS